MGPQVKTKPLLPTKSLFCVAVYLIAMYRGTYHDIYPDIYRDTTPQHCLSLDNEVICDAHRRLNPCLGGKRKYNKLVSRDSTHLKTQTTTPTTRQIRRQISYSGQCRRCYMWKSFREFEGVYKGGNTVCRLVIKSVSNVRVRGAGGGATC